jgi:hypothetical protein
VADVRSAHNEEVCVCVCVCVWLPAAQRPNHLLGCVDQSINVLVVFFGFLRAAKTRKVSVSSGFIEDAMCRQVLGWSDDRIWPCVRHP